MTKEVFLKELREALQNEIGDDEIESNVSYYKNYIENHVESEAAAIDELGDPRLIAKTIIDTTPTEIPHGGTVNEDGYQNTDNPFLKPEVPWYKKVFNWVFFLFILFLVLRVLGVIAGLFFRIGIPILIIAWIIHMVRNR